MRAQGYLIATGPGGTMEADTITCGHCNTIHVIASAGWCLRCTSAICGTCEATGRCVPFEKKLIAWERREALTTACKEG